LNALPITPPIDVSIREPFWALFDDSDELLGFSPAPNPVLYSTRALYGWPGSGSGDSLIITEFDRATGALDILCRDDNFFSGEFLRSSVALQPVNATFAYGRFQFDYFNGDQRDFQRGGTLLRVLERDPPTTTPPPPTTGTTGIPPPVTTGTTGVPPPTTSTTTGTTGIPPPFTTGTTGVPPTTTTGTTASPPMTTGDGGGGDSTNDEQIVIFSVVGSVVGCVLLLLVGALATLVVVSLQDPARFRQRRDD
jgi:hypothetical protein